MNLSKTKCENIFSYSRFYSQATSSLHNMIKRQNTVLSPAIFNQIRHLKNCDTISNLGKKCDKTINNFNMFLALQSHFMVGRHTVYI